MDLPFEEPLTRRWFEATLKTGALHDYTVRVDERFRFSDEPPRPLSVLK
jgi:hypothetical protein